MTAPFVYAAVLCNYLCGRWRCPHTSSDLKVELFLHCTVLFWHGI